MEWPVTSRDGRRPMCGRQPEMPTQLTWGRLDFVRAAAAPICSTGCAYQVRTKLHSMSFLSQAERQRYSRDDYIDEGCDFRPVGVFGAWRPGTCGRSRNRRNRRHVKIASQTVPISIWFYPLKDTLTGRVILRKRKSLGKEKATRFLFVSLVWFQSRYI